MLPNQERMWQLWERALPDRGLTRQVLERTRQLLERTLPNQERTWQFLERTLPFLSSMGRLCDPILSLRRTDPGFAATAAALAGRGGGIGAAGL